MTALPQEKTYDYLKRKDTTMTIVKQTPNLKATDIYSMTKGSDVRKMADFEGEVIDITKFILYTDASSSGDEMTILCVETTDGTRIATNSATFIRNFWDIQTIFDSCGEEAPKRYKVGSGRSRSNRKYLTCDIA